MSRSCLRDAFGVVESGGCAADVAWFWGGGARVLFDVGAAVVVAPVAPPSGSVVARCSVFAWDAMRRRRRAWRGGRTSNI